jgi:peptide deformylase
MAMAVRRILQVEIPEDYKVLKTKSVRVGRFDEGLRTLAADMVETMRDSSGVGLAAPQIGLLRRLIVVEVQALIEELEDGTQRELKPAELYVMVNPEILKSSEETFAVQEGCLSLPGRYGEVVRKTWISLRYQDLEGKEQRLKQLEATPYSLGHIVQHEIDHLDGVLFTEKLTDIATLKDLREEARPRRRWPRRDEPAETVQEETK